MDVESAEAFWQVSLLIHERGRHESFLGCGNLGDFALLDVLGQRIESVQRNVRSGW